MRWYERLPLARKTALVIAVAVLTLILLWVFTHAVMLYTLEALSTQERLIRINRSVAEVDISLLQAKADLRSFILSGEQEYRRRFESALVQRQDRVQELRLILAPDQEQLLRLERLDRLMAVWYGSYAQPLLERQAQGQPFDPAQLGTAGHAHLEEAQRLLDELQAAQGEVTTAMVAQARALIGRNDLRMLLLAVLATLIMVTLLLQFSRQIRRGVALLQLGAEAVATGRIERIHLVEGSDELGILTGHFNRLAASLLAQKEELQAQHEELVAQNELLLHHQQEMGQIQAEVEAERDQAASLNGLVRLLQEQPTLESLCQAMLDQILEKGDAQVGAMLLTGEGEARVVASVGLSGAATSIERLTGLMAEAAKRNAPFVHAYPDVLLHLPIYSTEVPVMHELYLPVADHGGPQAMVVLGRTGNLPFSAADQRWLEIFVGAAGSVLANRLSFYAAQHQRDLLRHVLDSINEGILLIRADDTMLFNPRYFELINVPVPAPGTHFAEVEEAVTAGVRDNPVFQQLVEKAQVDPLATLSARLELAGMPGRVLDFYWVSLIDQAGVKIGRLNVIRDVSDEATVDRMKSEFLSSVSHELRTPLTSIRGYAELLLEGDLGPVPAEQMECLNVIRENSLHLSGLINDLLEIEKPEQERIALACTAVDLESMLRRTVHWAEPQARQKGLSLTLESAPLPQIRGDEGRLVQVMNNLLSNAIKYTKEGGVRVVARPVEGQVEIQVTDTGIGIPPEGLDRLFTRFYRIDNAYTREVGGVGLGLAITKELVERHGGRITVTSEPGKGTTFRVRLPVGEPRASA